MSISPIIDRRYRLTPQDLGQQDRVVTIDNVSWQGLETLTPLLHLREFPSKRLVLDRVQQQELLQILGTPTPTAWIGQQLVIAAQSDHDALRIHLFPLKTGSRMPVRQSSTIQVPQSMGATLLLLALLGLLFLLVPLLDRSQQLWQWLQHF